MKTNIIGYQVHEVAENDPIEQVLVLRHAPGYPVAGVLDWPNIGEARSLFPDRNTARAAIERTAGMRKAFAGERCFPGEEIPLKIVPVKGV